MSWCNYLVFNMRTWSYRAFLWVIVVSSTVVAVDVIKQSDVASRKTTTSTDGGGDGSKGAPRTGQSEPDTAVPIEPGDQVLHVVQAPDLGPNAAGAPHLISLNEALEQRVQWQQRNKQGESGEQESNSASEDSDVSVLLAQLLGRGNQPLDVSVARHRLLKMADAGISADAQMLTGFLHAVGLWGGSDPPPALGVDQSRALLYYTFAALGGSVLAQMALGYRHLYGIHTPASCETALIYYQQASVHVINGTSAARPALSSPVFVNAVAGGGGGSSVVSRVRLYDELEGAGVAGASGSASGTVGSATLNEDLVQYYQFLADKGDEQAQLGLGQLLYHGGRGVDRDHEKALLYISSAAQAGSVAARAFLGKMYLEGNPTLPVNTELAMHFFRLASDEDNALGNFGVGFLLAREGNFARAVGYLKRAAEQGWAEALVQLGTMYYHGQGVVRDLHKAFEYLTRAAESGNLLAIFNLAQLHATGTGVLRSCRIAVDLYKNVAERGSWAKLFMEAHDDFWRARSKGDSQLLTAAALKYLLLSELGFEVAQSNAAYLLELAAFGGSSTPVLEAQLFPPDQLHARALPLWSRAAGQGCELARIRLGDYHYYGRGTPVDLHSAVEHYRIASDQLRSAQAMFNLGYMHECGLGLPVDLHLAKRLYDSAAETSADARVPIFLASLKLNAKFLLADLSTMDLSWPKVIESMLGDQWDIYMMSFLTAALLSALLLRRRR